MTEKRHRVRSAVSPDPCVMFMIYKYWTLYSCLAPGELSQGYAISRCGLTELNCMQFLIYNKCELLLLIWLIATSRDKNNLGVIWVGWVVFTSMRPFMGWCDPTAGNQLQRAVIGAIFGMLSRRTGLSATAGLSCYARRDRSSTWVRNAQAELTALGHTQPAANSQPKIHAKAMAAGARAPHPPLQTTLGNLQCCLDPLAGFAGRGEGREY